METELQITSILLAKSAQCRHIETSKQHFQPKRTPNGAAKQEQLCAHIQSQPEVLPALQKLSVLTQPTTCTPAPPPSREFYGPKEHSHLLIHPLSPLITPVEWHSTPQCTLSSWYQSGGVCPFSQPLTMGVHGFAVLRTTSNHLCRHLAGQAGTAWSYWDKAGSIAVWSPLHL